jgi:hypothetical protein
MTAGAAVPLILLGVLGLEGCRSTPARADRGICVREGTPVGARVTLTSAGPMGNWTEPEAYVVTSLHGRSGRCPSDALPIAARAVAESVHAERAAKAQEHKNEFRRVAKVEAGDVFPAGALHVAIHTLRKLGDENAAWLVVNLDSTGEKGERSYVADAVAHCKSGGLSLAWWTTYRKIDGAGEVVASQAHSPVLTIEKPSAALAAAKRAMCELSEENR